MHHGRGLTTLLQQAGRPADDAEALVAALGRDHRLVTVPGPERAMLDYADKLTRTPQSMGPEDVQRLRDAGLDDRAIHDLCAVVAYFGFVNRIADGLGVELESEPGRGHVPSADG